MQIWRSTFGLASLVSLIFAVSMLIIGSLVYEITHEALEQQLDHRVAIETEALYGVARAAKSSEVAVKVRERTSEARLAGLRYIVTDSAGRRLAGQLSAAMPDSDGFVELQLASAGSVVVQALVTRLADGGRLVVAADRDVIDETDATLWRLFAWAFGLTVLLGVGAAGTVGTVTRLRLRRLDGAARAIIAGDLTRRMPIDGSASEFDQLSITLNEMLDRISALVANLRHVSGDIAHDLRTPLTRLKNRLDSATRHAAGTNPQNRDLVLACEQADELLEIFAAMLRISEIEALGVRHRFTAFDISAVTASMIETYQPEAEAHGLILTADIAANLCYVGDRRLWQQLMANLLDNTLTHTPAGTRAHVSLTGNQGGVVFSVADDGPGVAQDELAFLFQRFRRSETSRSSAGHGLGLALVEAITHAHAGKVSAKLMSPGLLVTVRLPCSKQG